MKVAKVVSVFFLCLVFVALQAAVAVCKTDDEPDDAVQAVRTSLDEPVIIGLGEHQAAEGDYSKLQQAYSFILSNTSATQTEYLLYPESFVYNDPENGEFGFPHGAVIKLSDEDLGDTFDFIRTRTTVDLLRAKALYDGHIAVLDAEATVGEETRHLTYESDAFCHILHTYIGKHERCFTGFDDYEEYLADDDYPEKEASSIIFAHPEDIAGGDLLVGGGPFFELLILPDLTFGYASEVLAALGEDGAAQIRAFVEAGGTVFASGKSAWLLQQMGLLADGTVDASIVVRNRENKGLLSFSADTEFDSNLARLGLIREDDGESYATYFLSSFYVNAASDPGLVEVASFELESGQFYFQDPDSLLEIPREHDRMTAIAWKKHGDGTILVQTGHPASGNEKYFPLVFNMVFDAMAKNIIADLKVVQKTSDEVAEDVIPALESDVKLLGSFDVRNFFDEKITDVNLYVNVAAGFDTDASAAAGCEETANASSAYSETIHCVVDEIAAFENSSFEFPMIITDASVTQKKWGILAAAGQVVYKTADGKNEEVDTGPRTLTAYRGAEIRAEYNPDPSSFYPLEGEGVFIDNVLTAENKEDTNADEVEHIAVIPLVSPVVDGNDQASLVYTIEFYDQYYKSRQSAADTNAFVFPFENATDSSRDYDYIDYKTLKCTDTVLSADWDTPVKTTMELRSETGLGDPPECPDKEIGDIVGKDYAYSATVEDQVARQRYFADADNYYEHATQRLLVFLDTTKEAGALSYYGDTIPDEMDNDGKAKKTLIFARNDIYFYDNANYPLPEGLSDDPDDPAYGYDIFFTIDRFIDQSGDGDGIVNPGYFDDELENGVKANEYENKLKWKMGKTPVDFADIETFTGGMVKTSHYLFPIDDVDEIDEASDLAHFDPATGEYEEYPEVKFIKAHTVDFTIEQDTTPRGGRFTFALPAGVDFPADVDPVEKDLISLSADHIAVRDIQYDRNARIVTVDFLRGRMPDQTHGKPDTLRLNLEDLEGAAGDIAVSASLESVNYDLGNPDDMVTYEPVESFAQEMTLSSKPFFSLPCLVMKFRLHRGNEEDESYFQRYEYFEPFVRYGVYIQELLRHRTVYGYTENHPVSDPGLVVRSGGFSTFSNIGASSIPFREYLQTGVRQIIPSAPETSRVDYQDIWKRQWTTPIRTVLPDVPPIPPPLRNFMINTTFEIRDAETGERQLEWNSERDAELLLKVKLVNNYPKYFEPTISKENEFLLRGAGANAAPNLNEKQYIEPDPQYYVDSGDSDKDEENLYLRRANSARYGTCYQTEGDMAGGVPLNEQQRIDILNAQLCEDADEDCINTTGIPTVSRRPEGETGDWNFSHAAESYFPDNYISESMWSLTHYDYADDAFAKGYPYHMDNRVPNLDNVRGGILRPHNIIAQPIFKGLGFSVSYDRTYQSLHFTSEGEPIVGWRSDNLQNKDDTLLGGQQTANAISVDKTDLMGDRWVELSQMLDVSPYDQNAFSNIYSCLFNRWRAKVKLDNDKVTYAPNVFRNNVVPIIPDLDKNDERLTSYECGDEYYLPGTVHEVDNVVETDAKDWLYFGAALRGEAKETVNVVSQLSPISGVRYEGSAKVNDGARFVYWNPANGPNSFLVLDNEVNVVEALQSRITLAKEVLPVEVPTFNADIYHLITVADWAESSRQFAESPWLKHYGFADATTSVQVGTAQNLEARGSILSPGEETTIKIELFNNSGYDWNLIKSADGVMAIESIELPPEAINANDLLNGLKHAIKEPSAFNFLQFDIPEELQGLVEIKPSTHNIRVAGILFDFENINVTTIRDSYKGTYLVDMTLSGEFPDELRGKTYDIGVSLVPEFFDAYPGHANDPVAHDYALAIPSIRFGVPYGENQGNLAGKVYRTSGYSTGVTLVDQYPEGIDPQTVKSVTWSELSQFRQAAENPETRQQQMAALYEGESFGQEFSFDKQVEDDGITLLTLAFDQNGIAKFPMPLETGPDQTSLLLLVRSSAPHLSYGEHIVNQETAADYLDFDSNEKTAGISSPAYREVRAVGADLRAEYSAALISETTGELLPVQALNPDGDNLIELGLRIENAGSDIAYNPVVRMYLPNELELVEVLDIADVQTYDEDGLQVLEVALSDDIGPGDGNLIRMRLRLEGSQPIGLLDLFVAKAYAADGQVLIVDHVDAVFDLVETPGVNRVTQETAGAFYLAYATEAIPTLVLQSTQIGPGTYRIDVSVENIELETPYYRLFIVYDGETYPVFDGYQSSDSFEVTIENGPVELYGILYEETSGDNATGDPVYEQRAVSLAITLQYGGVIPTLGHWGVALLAIALSAAGPALRRCRKKQAA